MAQFKIGTHVFAAQVEVAVLHPQVVAAVRVVLNGERWSLGGIEYRKFCHDYLNVARRHLGVLVVSFVDLSSHLYHVLTTEFIGCITKCSIRFFVEYQLCDAVTVTQIDKRHSAHFADALDPSSQGDFGTYVADA